MEEPLAGAEIHGFLTAADLDTEKLMEEASSRWFRPNEVHAILSNYTRFKVQPQPLDNPSSGTVLLFDRKVVRNFRKDGHNWKKKKDGKAVQEAHEKLKVGNEERVHVYYARGEDDPNFYRRCYWLLDKALERIVLVHYRRTSEDAPFVAVPAEIECVDPTPIPNRNNNYQHNSPLTPVNSSSASAHSEVSGGALVCEEINSKVDHANPKDAGKHEFSLDEINTLDWNELLESPIENDPNSVQPGGPYTSAQQIQSELRIPMNTTDMNLLNNGNNPPLHTQTYNGSFTLNQSNNDCFQYLTGGAQPQPNYNSNNNVIPRQDSLGQWNFASDDTLGGLLEETQIEKPGAFPSFDPSLSHKQLFNITDVSPGWAYCSEETKILVVGCFSEQYKHLSEQYNLYCTIGGKIVNTQMIQPGVYRCMAPPNAPGNADLYLTLDCRTPISQVLSFNYLSKPSTFSSENNIDNIKVEKEKADVEEEFVLQMRLAHLLFSTSNKIPNSSFSNKSSPKSLKEPTKFALVTGQLMEKYWANLLKQGPDCKIESLLEMILRNKLQEWLLERVTEGRKITGFDAKGQGAIHLCAMLDYTWAIRLFSLSGISLDFRDSCGWTALHWAAFLGREKTVAALLSAGANASLVTDPTPDSPGGSTAADLAAKQGFEGLAAYLAEEGLSAHFHAMRLSGNMSHQIFPANTMQTSNFNSNLNFDFTNLSEQELCLKDSLAAYRNAAEAATKIQSAIKERALNLQAKAVRMEKPENEAESIVAALKIQNAFRSYNRRKAMRAAAQIQSHFRTWKTRRNFLNMRRQAIRIQAVFRGHQVRKQYKKIVWSVGILEKAVLRWRLKRRGLRGIQSDMAAGPVVKMDMDSSAGTGEEDFFRMSREQAEDRYKRSVVRVQALFRSYQAQQEYRRMKMAHELAKMEFDELNESN